MLQPAIITSRDIITRQVNMTANTVHVDVAIIIRRIHAVTVMTILVIITTTFMITMQCKYQYMYMQYIILASLNGET